MTAGFFSTLPAGDRLPLHQSIGNLPRHALCRIVKQRLEQIERFRRNPGKITGLTIGADDYITKPFNPLEMVARVKAQLRRYTRYNDGGPKPGENVIDFAGLVINKDTHSCTLYDRELNLTPIEFSLLWLLCENRGRVLSSEELFERVWGERYLDSNNTIMVHIRRLREKMGEPPRNPKFIKTVWGVGYKIEQ